MTIRTSVISPDIQEILNQGRTEDNLYFITSGQLDRPTYDKVNKVLVGLGGKWNRSKKAHVFPSVMDAENVFTTSAAGEIAMPKDNGFFPTPAFLSELLVSDVVNAWYDGRTTDIKHIRVLEPSAGHGALLDPLTRQWGIPKENIDCVELIPQNQEILRGQGYSVVHDDFLTFPQTRQEDDLYDLAVMNPPFINTTYIDHIQAAYKCMAVGGIIGAIMPQQVLQRTGAKADWMRDMLNNPNNILLIRYHDPGSFKAEGTEVATLHAVFTKS